MPSWLHGWGAAAGLTVAVLLFLGWFSFTEFKIGTFQTETDFYWSYWPKAEKLSHGELIWGDFRPPFYAMVLAVTHIFVADWYRAGMLLSLLSALAVGMLSFAIVRRLWGDNFALVSLGLLLVHPEFTRHAYCPGTDMFFFALSAGAVLAGMLKKNLVAGVLIGLAFMTRYNGIFLLPVALYFSERRRPLLLGFGAVTTLFAAISFHVTGALFPNRNYLNVAFMLFGEHRQTWDEFWYTTSDTQYSSLRQVLLMDPLHSIWSLTKNLGVHWWKDMQHLATWPVGILALLGLFSERSNRDLRPLLWYGFFLYLTLCLVFYSERFSLFLLLLYVPLAGRGLLWIYGRYFLSRSARSSS